MSRQARLGLVVLVGIASFVLALFILANRSFLLSDTFSLRAEFTRVAGLQTGAVVYYQGISVGRVETIELPASPGQPIIVAMRVREAAHHLIREDSRAVVQTDGLVGAVVVSITGGSARRPVVAENGLIEGVDPLDFTQVSDRLFTSVARFDSVTVTLTQMMQDVRAGEGSLGMFLYDDRLYNETILTAQELRGSLSSLTARADALVAIAGEASQGVEDIISQVAYGDGTLARFLREDSIYTALLRASDQFSTISTDVRGITDRFEDAAGWAALGAFRFSENMEALKHNFLFKPYFEERGYLEMAPFELREQAISETFRALQERERLLLEEARRLEAIREDLRRRGLLPEEPPVRGTLGSPSAGTQ
ncbi:MAG TPA: MlaD family protein [Rubricoccaceae bacterium]|nr:MlaD family protein [Rubricoccaceae bacterium]